MDAASAQQMFQHGLRQAQDRVSHNWEAETVTRRTKTMQELDQWLQQLPAEWNKGLMTCTPADLVVYLETHWLGEHAGTQLSNGTMIASPKGVSQCLSHCSTGFKLLGRVGQWDPLHASGNPVESSLVTQYRKGYKLEAWRSGYLEGSAVPMTAGKILQLVGYLDMQIAGMPLGIKQLLLERDIVMQLLMWETTMRGNNCGRLAWTDFFLESGQPAPFPMAGVQTLMIKPNGTKTVKGERSGPWRHWLPVFVQSPDSKPAGLCGHSCECF